MTSKEFKYFIRSWSYSFTMSLRDKSHRLNSFDWNSNKVFYRSSTSDMTLIYEILLKSDKKAEYFFPIQIKPKVILDIGANIGVTSIYLAKLFPDALIYSFEPLKDNFEILEKNIQSYKNISAFNIALGSKNGYFKVYYSDDSENFGGASLYSNGEGNDSKSFSECEVKNISDTLDELKIDSVDLIKIDTEGAEFEILSSLKGHFLQNISWITGELHGKNDFKLLDYLVNFKFSISLTKQIDNRLFMFSAGKDEIISKLSKKQKIH
jgi:FkbM family methyltransferase